jgi:phosphoglycerate kinase
LIFIIKKLLLLYNFKPTQITMITIDDFNFNNKKALIRVDFNVPLDQDFNVSDDTRITSAIPTIKKILDDGGSVILMSHLGRPKNGFADKYSLRHVVSNLSKHLGIDVKFVADCIGEKVKNEASNLKKGEVLLLENLRFYPLEEAGSEDFSKQLSELADIYVNDAFGTAHRAHASTTIVAKYFKEKCFGYLMAAELKNAEKVLNTPERPFTAILGGAKVSGKIMIIEQLLDKVNNLIIGGGMAYTFIKAKGGKIGNSLIEDDKIETALKVMKIAEEKGVKIYLPVDTIYADAFDNDANKGVSEIDEIPNGMMGLDIGSKSIKLFEEVISNSKTLLWNGPMGVFEMSNFAEGTLKIALAVAKATQENDAYSLVGGGDSVAAVNKFDLKDKVSYVSTGGGAMLELLEGKELPGVTAIK